MLPVRLPDGSLINTTVAKIQKDSRIMILQICSEDRSKASKAGSLVGGLSSDGENSSDGSFCQDGEQAFSDEKW